MICAVWATLWLIHAHFFSIKCAVRNDKQSVHSNFHSSRGWLRVCGEIMKMQGMWGNKEKVKGHIGFFPLHNRNISFIIGMNVKYAIPASGHNRSGSWSRGSKGISLYCFNGCLCLQKGYPSKAPQVEFCGIYEKLLAYLTFIRFSTWWFSLL